MATNFIREGDSSKPMAATTDVFAGNVGGTPTFSDNKQYAQATQLDKVATPGGELQPGAINREALGVNAPTSEQAIDAISARQALGPPTQAGGITVSSTHPSVRPANSGPVPRQGTNFFQPSVNSLPASLGGLTTQPGYRAGDPTADSRQALRTRIAAPPPTIDTLIPESIV